MVHRGACGYMAIAFNRFDDGNLARSTWAYGRWKEVARDLIDEGKFYV